MRTKILAANWKMHKTSEEASSFVQEFKKKISKPNRIEIIIAPPFTALETVAKVREGSFIKLGAQNVHWEEKGAFTGEISAPMLTSIGCEYVIVGHSERRHIFLETLEMIQNKVSQSLQHKLKVILCVGETLQEREQKKTLEVIKEQLVSGLKKVSKDHLKEMVIAYEPVWAIGTGNNATPEQAEEAHRFIRKVMWDLYDMQSASYIPIIYGGSVNASNFKAISLEPNVDGALVGSASLQIKTFIEILKQMA